MDPKEVKAAELSGEKSGYDEPENLGSSQPQPPALTESEADLHLEQEVQNISPPVAAVIGDEQQNKVDENVAENSVASSTISEPKLVLETVTTETVASVVTIATCSRNIRRKKGLRRVPGNTDLSIGIGNEQQQMAFTSPLNIVTLSMPSLSSAPDDTDQVIRAKSQPLMREESVNLYGLLAPHPNVSSLREDDPDRCDAEPVVRVQTGAGDMVHNPALRRVTASTDLAIDSEEPAAPSTNLVSQSMPSLVPQADQSSSSVREVKSEGELQTPRPKAARQRRGKPRK